MKKFFSSIGRILVTLVVVVAAVFVAYRLWDYYVEAPWTRDGHVRADVVGVTPDVSGLVSQVLVHDDQTVKQGDVLFQVDKARFTLALNLATATLQGAQATLDQAKRDMARSQQLAGQQFSTQQALEQAQSAVALDEANLQVAMGNRDVAQLNLDRSVIKAPSNGVISNMDLNVGDYVSAGKAVLALVDTDTLRVEGYFEENKLPRIHVGDAVSVQLMGHPAKLTGHVESIASGIADRERTDDTNLLANVTPTFSWVRLAQRVPVRVKLDPLPAGVTLVAGLTATVTVEQPH